MARRTTGAQAGVETPDDMALALGDGYDEIRDDVWRAAWARARDRMLAPAELANAPGSRPWAWWHFDAPDDTPPELFAPSVTAVGAHDRQVATIRFLTDRGLLAAEERQALLERVRELAADYSDYDPYENLAWARELAAAAGVDATLGEFRMGDN